MVVYDEDLRSNSETGLCGMCFFASRLMLDWDLWNDDLEATE